MTTYNLVFMIGNDTTVCRACITADSAALAKAKLRAMVRIGHDLEEVRFIEPETMRVTLLGCRAAFPAQK